MALKLDLQLAVKNAWDFTGLPEEYLPAYRARARNMEKLALRILDKSARGVSATADERNFVSLAIGNVNEVTSESAWGNNLRIRAKYDIHHLSPLKENQLVGSYLPPAQHLEFTHHLNKQGVHFGNSPVNGVATNALGHKGSKAIEPGKPGSVQMSFHPRGTNTPLNLIPEGLTPRETAQFGAELNQGNIGAVLRQLKEGTLQNITEGLVKDYYETITGTPADLAAAPIIKKVTKPYLSQIQRFVGDHFQIPERLHGALAVDPNSAVLAQAGKLIKNNPVGAIAGALQNAVSPESAYSLGRGDYGTAASQGLQSAGIGAVAGAMAQGVAKHFAPRLASTLASGPLMPYVAATQTAMAADEAALAYRAGSNKRSIPLQQKIEASVQNQRKAQDAAQFRAAMPGHAYKNRVQPDLSGKLSAQQSESFRAGGGNAAMQRDGLSVEQVIQRGSDLRLKEIHSRIIREET